jgi:hypothetical protein
MMSIFQGGSAQTVSVETDELLGDSHWRSVNPDMDDASPANISALIDKAKQLIDTEHDRIEDLAKVLAEPKVNVQPKGRLPEKGMLVSRRTEGGA